MIRQYSPQRFRYETIRAANISRTVAVGTIPVGTVFYWAGSSRKPSPHIVEAWMPREIGAWRRGHDGRWQPTYVANAGHLAQVRCLANGRRRQLADHIIRFCLDDD